MPPHHITRTPPPAKSVPLSTLTDLETYIQGYILHHRSQRHSQWTVAFYRTNLGLFAWWLGREGVTELAAITPNAIRQFFLYLQDTVTGRWGKRPGERDRPLKPSTIHAFGRILRAFFTWASKEAPLERNPFASVQMPKLPPDGKVEAFSDDETVLLFAACGESETAFLVQRNRTVLAILIDSGLRAGELLGLTLDDIAGVFEQGVFTVTGKGEKVREVVIGDFARHELWVYYTKYRKSIGPQRGDDALFLAQNEEPLTYWGLKGLFKALKERTGISRVAVKPHNCRHTFATKARRNGIRGEVLQGILGHAKFDTTRRFYLDVTTEDLVHEHARYGPLDNMRGELHRAAHNREHGGREAASKLPDNAALAKEVAVSSIAAVARKYLVSETTVRNRVKSVKRK